MQVDLVGRPVARIMDPAFLVVHVPERTMQLTRPPESSALKDRASLVQVCFSYQKIRIAPPAQGGIGIKGIGERSTLHDDCFNTGPRQLLDQPGEHGPVAQLPHGLSKRLLPKVLGNRRRPA